VAATGCGWRLPEGPTYLLGAEDVDSSVMLVVVESGDGAVRRQATPPVGPVLASP
jgi:hypothetical protein